MYRADIGKRLQRLRPETHTPLGCSLALESVSEVWHKSHDRLALSVIAEILSCRVGWKLM